MGRKLQQGFTIIEVILVLAITGLLISGILVNSGNQLKVQHYREGVLSFRDILAGAFEDIDAVKNDKGDGVNKEVRCADIISGDNNSTWRGAAKCFYSGKSIEIVRSGETTKFIIRPVKSYTEPATNVAGSTPTTIYHDSDDKDLNIKEFTADWGVQARQAKPNTGSAYDKFRIRLVRSPEDGRVMLQQSSDGGVKWEFPSQDITFCLANPYDINNPKNWQAITIAKHSVNATGITTQSGESLCGGGL